MSYGVYFDFARITVPVLELSTVPFEYTNKELAGGWGGGGVQLCDKPKK